ncbi:toll-like receptor 4 [Biomphalaria pfeifferi]|uniref:Toll-like receptor 4 n=1 Tax=Biomphalaria pfeifferi TaxID=112525 RepID=A0AAD8B661_BIOPF|nr:toll-like receptor 4 [Biomphalaria pfeifferi]
MKANTLHLIHKRMIDAMFSNFLKTYLVLMYLTLVTINISSSSRTMSGNEDLVISCCKEVKDDDFNCSSLNWTFVDLRCLPASTKKLILDNNNLTRLTNGSFHTLSSLQQLSIKSSHVKHIELDAFLGLSNLQSLNLENNLLSDIAMSFDAQAFRHLTNLKQLLTGHNLNISRHLKDTFHLLPNVTSLSMDGDNTLNVSHEFVLLTKMKNLTLYCWNVTKVTSQSFSGLWRSDLKILNLIGFDRLTFDPVDINPDFSESQFNDDAFQNLKSLEVLKIVNCRIGNTNMARKLKHFVNSSLHTLYLETTHYRGDFYSPNSTYADGVILTSTAKYLSQLTLSQFSWVDSDIFAIAPGVISSPQWRYNLKLADFSNNMMGWLGWRFPLLEAARLEKLEGVIITSPSSDSEVSSPSSYLQQFLTYNIQGLIQTAEHSKEIKLINSSLQAPRDIGHRAFRGKDPFKEAEKELNVLLQREPITTQSSSQSSLQSSSQSSRQSSPQSSRQLSFSTYNSISKRELLRFSDNPPYPTNSGTWTIRMPLSLRVCQIMYTFHGDNNYGNQSFRFIQTSTEAANLSHFYFVGNSRHRGIGRFLGLTNLQLFDLSENALYIANYFFDDFPTLKYLILKSIKNEDFFQRLPIDRIVQNLPKLTYLDLSDNKLYYLPPNLFHRNPNMSHVILSKNKFSSLPIRMTLVQNLKLLDLTGNAIIYLTEEETSSLTKHKENVPDFSLALAENNIACVCSQIQFLFWLNTSDFLDNTESYFCTSQEGQLIAVGVVSHDLFGFYRQCNGYEFLMISIVLLLVMSFTFLMAYLMHRFRTAIEAYLVRIFIKAFRPMKSSDYKTHVFIGYADDDVGFVRHILLRYLEKDVKVSTFVHHRDLGPGYNDQQMFVAMRDSWRILLVITESFLNNYDLSDIVMKYASHSVTPATQGRVVALVQQTQLHNIPGYLYDVLEDSRIIVLSDLISDLDYEDRQSIIECLRDVQ